MVAGAVERKNRLYPPELTAPSELNMYPARPSSCRVRTSVDEGAVTTPGLENVGSGTGVGGRVGIGVGGRGCGVAMTGGAVGAGVRVKAIVGTGVAGWGAMVVTTVAKGDGVAGGGLAVGVGGRVGATLRVGD